MGSSAATRTARSARRRHVRPRPGRQGSAAASPAAGMPVAYWLAAAASPASSSPSWLACSSRSWPTGSFGGGKARRWHSGPLSLAGGRVLPERWRNLGGVPGNRCGKRVPGADPGLEKRQPTLGGSEAGGQAGQLVRYDLEVASDLGDVGVITAEPRLEDGKGVLEVGGGRPARPRPDRRLAGRPSGVLVRPDGEGRRACRRPSCRVTW